MAFETALRGRYVYRDESSDDYGIDGTVEEFDGTGLATGLRFHAQLKATDEQDLSRSLAVPIKRDTAAYYRSLTLPVLMVRYRASEDALYARWFHQFDPIDDGTGEKVVSFRWEPEDLFDESTPARLAKEARAFLALRSAALLLPLDLHLDVAPEGAYGLGPSALRFALRSAVATRPDVFSVRSGPAPSGAVRVVARDDLLSVNLGEVTTATAQLERYDAGEVGERFGVDAMVMAALAFEHIGRTDVATRLTTGFLQESLLAGSPEVAWGLSSALRRSRRIHEALRLAEALDASGDPRRREASFPFMLIAKWHGQTLESDELKAFEEVIEHRIQRCLEAGDELEAGHNSYNLANVLRSRCEYEKSLASFDRALHHDPAYAGRAYFHKERAGMLFHAGRYLEAAAAYEQAYRLETDSLTVGLRADALMFSGRYEDARAGFAEYNTITQGDGQPEWRLKEAFLGILVDQLCISSQDRYPSKATSTTGDLDYERTPTDELVSRLEAVLHVDALSACTWFNLGRAYLDSDNRDAALVAYLGAAVCHTADAEAWLDTLVLAIDRPETAHIANDALYCGARFAGQEFRSQLVRWTQAQEPGFPGEQMLTMIDEHLQEHQPAVREGMLLRHLGTDGQIDEMVLGGAEKAEDGSET
ncbi:MAG: DUF4365 domain-containing protein [Solirubrobacteraceae bacterium]